MNNFFVRENKSLDYKIYKINIFDDLNVDNVESKTSRQIKKLFNIKNFEYFLTYRFEVLNDWIRKNEVYTSFYVRRLEEVINKLHLVSEFNSYENEYIDRIKSLAFAKSRNLKNLITDFPLEDGESVYYKYSNSNMYKYFSNNLEIMSDNGECYITSTRIILLKNIELFSIYFNQVENYLFTKHGLIFILKNGTSYLINTLDNYVLYVSLERVLKLMKIEL